MQGCVRDSRGERRGWDAPSIGTELALRTSPFRGSPSHWPKPLIGDADMIRYMAVHHQELDTKLRKSEY